ncbi:MAG TPA: YdcF family protein [Roseiflexaceae bacterium]|nr:YdcF family protein [Roseiflexaceae bacterium]
MGARATRRILAGLLRGLAAAALSAAGLLLLVGALVLVQGQRDETRPVGAAVVLAAELWPGDQAGMRQARLDHVLDLYRRGVVSRIILTGARSEVSAGISYLVERGVSPEALLEEPGVSTLACLRSAAARARSIGAGSVLLVSDPAHMLRALKMARDLGLAAYGSPTFTSPATRSFTAELAYVARETWAYVVYIFAQR